MFRVRLSSALVIAVTSFAGAAVAAEPSAEARRLYAEGKAEYAQGHYDVAVTLFERSYALSESPALLFNMAQAHRLAGPGHCADALALYKSYLSALPEAENRKEVEERIRELGDCPVKADASAESQPARATPPPPPSRTVRLAPVPPPVARGSSLPTGPVLVTGSGAALLVAGGVLYARAWDKHREAERVCPCYPGTYSTWEVLTNVSYALMVVGGATLAGGVTWWVVAQPRDNAAPAQAMLGVQGAF